MQSENAIEVRDLKKKFKVFYDKGTSLKERILFRKRNRYEERWVLSGISFDVKKGEAIGLVGHNGCGKSTTLKLLTRIIYPDEGSIEIKGRVSSMIELGAGFHPDMSGRENIYIYASIFGLTKKEIDERMDDIIEFSELEEFLDNPVRTYSSGMYTRLAFSVAINVKADVLLIDEILAVGDANFQAKCFNKLREIKANGTTIVIVSHALSQIEQICERSIWIQDGLIKAEGTPREVHPQYMAFMGQKRDEINEKAAARKAEKEKQNAKAEKKDEKKPAPKEKNNKRWGNGKAEITSIRLTDENGKKKSTFAVGESFNVEIEYDVKEEVKNAVFGIGIFRSDGLNCYGTNTTIDKLDEFDLTESGKFTIKLKNVLLLPGEYTIDIAIECDRGTPVDYYREIERFNMYSVYGDVGAARIEHEWVK
ncbi:MAG: ABC transporter ATP-binding protein [Firmicutes bacterium]|nr:ABC transporter ATP-binding protein [Bacillota bacterium]